MNEIHYHQSSPEEPFSLLVRRVLRSQSGGVPEAEAWDATTKVLYLAVRVGGGPDVRAEMFQDRGTAMLGGFLHRGLTRYTEEDLPPWIHCPHELLEKLSPTGSETARVWRAVTRRWRTRCDALLEQTAKASPGDSITLLPPGRGRPVYEAQVNRFRAIEAAPGSTWPDLHEIVDLLGDGYVIRVRSSGR